MDEFDFKEEQQPRKRSGFGAAIWNCGSLFFFFAAIAVGIFFLVIFLNPQSEFNPLPPVAQAPTEPPTATATEVLLTTPTETPTSTPEPPTATPTVDEPGGTFGIQDGSPAALDSTVFHPELGCSFMGIAGQAFGLDGNPVSGMQIHVTGTLNGEAVDKVGVTGAATQFGAGSYYEVQLASTPVASENTLNITLLDTSGVPVSSLFTFSTTDSCQSNLILVNFAEQP
jgi:hypothetical protein